VKEEQRQMTFNPQDNHQASRKLVGYVEKNCATPQTYTRLGFQCGLEIHQQLKTVKKLFCRCPARIYQDKDDYDAQIIRHMRPTLSELGEYDGTALMEFKTKKNIFYRIKNKTACTYEIDDTPPFDLDEESLRIAIEIALLLRTSIVGELHITRKQYLDGSIPTGFQRTAIVGIEGEIPLKAKKIRIMQLSLEEDACREVSDIRHNRIYLTDRLGMPLVETVTYPDMKTPDEAAEAAQYIRFLTRSTGHVRTGIGAAREDVNVSITGGNRVEIKGVPRIKQIPQLTHNEAFRQKALLEIKKILLERIPDPAKWKISSMELPLDSINQEHFPFGEHFTENCRIMAVNLPKFKGILSFFTQPGQTFADELHDRLKVIACLEKPNMTHSEALNPLVNDNRMAWIGKQLKSRENDAQLIFWGPREDIKTALETIEERCILAFQGIPNETRKALRDGTTLFERVLPGPNRMYPDTDSPPIPIHDQTIENIKKDLPTDVSERLEQLRKWDIPADTYSFLMKRNLFTLMSHIIKDFKENPIFVGTVIGHTLKHLEGKMPDNHGFESSRIYNLFKFKNREKLAKEIIKPMLAVLYEHPEMNFNSVLKILKYRKFTEQHILSLVPGLKAKFKKIKISEEAGAEIRWIMGKLRNTAIGNMEMNRLSHKITEEMV
jgi:glutamyl-tRNA(Gln) amidotransferase subunit E